MKQYYCRICGSKVTFTRQREERDPDWYIISCPKNCKTDHTSFDSIEAAQEYCGINQTDYIAIKAHEKARLQKAIEIVHRFTINIHYDCTHIKEALEIVLDEVKKHNAS